MNTGSGTAPGAVIRESGTAIAHWLARHRERVAGEIGALVRIPTCAPDEPAATEHLLGRLADVGMTARVEPPHPGLASHADYTPPFLPGEHPPRPSLRAELPAPAGLPTVLFSAHVDVVPADGHPEPWSGRFDGDRVHGRGTCDTKNNIVMLMEAVRCIRDLDLPLRARVLLDLVADEEAGGNGALSTILHGAAADEVVVLEPTGLRVHHGHRGCIGFEVTAHGTTGHMGSARWETSPIETALAVIGRLRALEARCLSEAATVPGFTQLPRPLQLNLSAVRADAWHGSTPDRCTVRASLGFLPHRTRDQAFREIERAVRDAPDAGRLTLSWRGIRNDAFLGDPQGATARRLGQALAATGQPPSAPQPWHVSCDARLYARLTGADTVVFGSGDLALAHSVNESVEVDQVLRGTAALVAFLTENAETQENTE